MRPEFIARIKAEEGFSATAYWDRKQWSIGYGCVASGPNDTITEAEAHNKLVKELERAEEDFRAIFPEDPPNLTEARREALINMCFNMGPQVCRHPAPLSLSRVESLWLDQSMLSVGFVRAVADVLPRLCPKEFFRPAQVDPHGNFNNIAFGKDYLSFGRLRPRLRLPGSGGIPDVTNFSNEVYLYVPRHSKITFVPILDVCSGLGHLPQRTHGQGPRYLVSNLGQFDFAPRSEVGMNPSYPPEMFLRLTSYHPGVRIRANTSTYRFLPCP